MKSIWLALSVLAFSAIHGTSRADTHDGRPKILLHVMPTTTISPCTRAQLSDAANAIPQGALGEFSFVYVLAALGTMPNIGGIQFGITYDGGRGDGATNGSKLDIYGWTVCGSLSFPQPLPVWPSPGSGTIITWAQSTCQTGDVAVAGYFYGAPGMARQRHDLALFNR